MQLQNPLLVLSASAGSGKTFSLVQDYLKLTLRSKESAVKFGKILSMTFTNKAAWEMKERIIQALDELAYLANNPLKKNGKADGFLKLTAENLKMKPEQVQENARYLLSKILHAYEDFNVITIDKFNLRLIRTFARELDIADNFEVEMSTDQYIEDVLDEIMSNIGREDHQELTKLALNYSKTNFEEGDKWDFRKSLVEFAKVLNKESNYSAVDRIQKLDYTKEDFDNLMKEIYSLRSQHQIKCQKAYDLFNSYNLEPNELPGKTKGIHSFMSKLQSRDLSEKPPSATNLKAISGESVKDSHRFPSDLQNLLQELIAFEEENKSQYFILNMLRKHFHNLAFLKYIATEIEVIRKRDGVIMISEFNKLIADLLMKESAPFIYERLGTRFENYLLDEFQDTSRLQFLNLIPLIHDSLGNKQHNLIVGDPKQAIYRFRNGLVEQFVELPSIYNPEKLDYIAEKSAYFEQMGERKTLPYNWRSQKNIVQFNNHFFKSLTQFLPEDFQSFYADMEQEPKGSDGGHVSIEMWDSKESEGESEAIELAFIIEKIHKLKEEGFNYGDICILARRRKDASNWVKGIIQNTEGINVVSADSLFVKSDRDVKLFLSYLKLRRSPANSSIQKNFLVQYYEHKGENPIEMLAEFRLETQNSNNRIDFDSFIKSEFQSEEQLYFSFENMYDLGQKLASLLDMNELENPYLHYFMGMLQNFDLKNGPDLRAFLDFWSKTGHKESVQVPENDNAVKIMTAHVAKGLEFPVVILPTLSWDFVRMISKDSEFYEMEDELVYVNYTKNENAPQVIQDAYHEERFRRMLDEFNLLYVAMTRPVNRLYLFVDTKTPSKKKPADFGVVSQLVTEVLKNDLQIEGLLKSDERVSYGQEIENIQGNDKEDTNYFVPENLKDVLWFPDISLIDEQPGEEETTDRERRFGRQLHLILSEVENVMQVEATIDTLMKRDLIEFEMRDELNNTINQIFEIELFSSWHNGSYRILSEQDILIQENEVKRPDRIFIGENETIIVDFKTGKPSSKDKKQLSLYAKVLGEMSFKNIHSYLLYTDGMNLEKI